MTFNVCNLVSKYPYFSRAYAIGGLYPFCHGCRYGASLMNQQSALEKSQILQKRYCKSLQVKGLSSCGPSNFEDDSTFQVPNLGCPRAVRSAQSTVAQTPTKNQIQNFENLTFFTLEDNFLPYKSVTMNLYDVLSIENNGKFS